MLCLHVYSCTMCMLDACGGQAVVSSHAGAENQTRILWKSLTDEFFLQPATMGLGMILYALSHLSTLFQTMSKISSVTEAIKKKRFICTNGCLPACMHVYYVCTWCSPKPEEDVGCPDNCELTWVPKTKPGSSTKAASVLKHWAISPSPYWGNF